MENTTYLHNHSVYSLFDGAQTIKEMVERAKLLGCKNLALTDHGTMMGIPKFVEECRKNEIKPLIGVEIYMQNPDDEIDGISIINKGHSCLYAVNDEGYKQLCHIMSDSEKKQIRIGKSVYPITTFEILKKYVKRGDLIYTTACVGGYIPQILYFNKKQEEKISEINERLSKCNSPEDAGYKLLCGEINDIQNMLSQLAEDKKLIQKRAKQTYKKQAAIFNNLDYPEIDDTFSSSDEKNLLGMYITKTPLSGYPAPEDIGCITINKVNERNYTVKILEL